MGLSLAKLLSIGWYFCFNILAKIRPEPEGTERYLWLPITRDLDNSAPPKKAAHS